MIERYTDHAANERTMLAWVRTALAVAAFGFLVERMNIFMSMMATGQGQPHAPSPAVEWLGLALIAGGVAILLLSLVRYVRISRAISAPDKRPATTLMMDVMLFVMLAIVVVAVMVLLGHAMLPGSASLAGAAG